MRIDAVTLFSAQIQRQKQFYGDVLNLEMIADTSDFITFKTGNSTLSFRYNENARPSHIAFNIPSFQEKEALQWLKARVDVISFEKQSIIDFRNWNAKAIYFHDPDRNIIEFIARRDLNIKTDTEFTPMSLVAISEMAIATTNIESIYKQISMMKPIPIFDGNFDKFCALGNDEGLFILIDKTKKRWFPTNEEAFISDFIISGDYNFSYLDGEIKELL